jgi:outer membrane receptor protein involved in Fe transport
MDLQAAPTTAVVSAFDEIFFPADLKLRTGIAWAKGEFSSALFVNHTSSYEDTLVQPATNVSAWTTVDVQLQYAVTSAATAFLRGLTLALNIQNIADEDPPSIDVPPDSPSFLGYDPANATARGRFISVSLTKRW